jgi:hypothetical protein
MTAQTLGLTPFFYVRLRRLISRLSLTHLAYHL